MLALLRGYFAWKQQGEKKEDQNGPQGLFTLDMLEEALSHMHSASVEGEEIGESAKMSIKRALGSMFLKYMDCPVNYDCEGVFARESIPNKDKIITIYCVCCSDIEGVYTGHGYHPRLMIKCRKSTTTESHVVHLKFPFETIDMD